MKTTPHTIVVVTLTLTLLALSSVASARCTDSDPSDDPAVLGTVIDTTGSTYRDACSSNRVVQVSCDASGNVATSSAALCPADQTCDGGICQASSPFMERLVSDITATTTSSTAITTTIDTRPTASTDIGSATPPTTADTWTITAPDTTTITTAPRDTTITATTPDTTVYTAPAIITAPRDTTITATTPDTAAAATDTQTTIPATTIDPLPTATIPDVQPTTADTSRDMATTAVIPTLSQEPFIRTVIEDVAIGSSAVDTRTAAPTGITAVPGARATTTQPDSGIRETGTDTEQRATGGGHTPDTSDCTLRARRICALQNIKKTANKDIRLLSNIDIRDLLIEDSISTITRDDPAVQQTLAVEDPAKTILTTQDAQDTELSRLAYCIGRVAQLCKLSDTDRKFVIEDCSDPAYAKENTKRCTLRPVQEATCLKDNAPIPSTSSVFDVTKAKILNLPDVFKPDQFHNLVLLESSDDPLQQYILLPKDALDDTLEVLVVDPKTGLSRVLGLGKARDLNVVKDAKGTGTILMMTATGGIQYLPSASAVVAEKMKDAVSTDQLLSLPKTDLDLTAWKPVAIPADQTILFVQPNDAGVVVITGDVNGALKGIWSFVSVSNADGKFIPIPNASKYTLRKAIITPDNGKLAVDLALKSKGEGGSSFEVMHSADSLADPPTFIVLADKTAETETLEKANSKDSVKKAEKASAKKKPKDKDTFEKSLSDAVSSGAMGQPVVSHTFEDYGENSNALVIKEGGLGFVKTDNGVVKMKEGELLSLGADGSACGTIVGALPVDMDFAGGKDIALAINNSGVVSLVIYPNVNQLQKFESVTAEAKSDIVQLHQQSVTEENETLKCHWDAFQKMPDGTLKDVSSQLDNQSTCDPAFKPAAAEKTSLLKKPSIIDTAAEWLMAQISIRSAYADEVSATTNTDYIFRVTTTDPLGLEATEQVTAQVSTSTSTSTGVKIVDVKLQTPIQKDGVTTPATTPLNGGMTGGVGGHAALKPAGTPEMPGPEGLIVGPSEAPHGFAVEGGCSLARSAAPQPSLCWLWMLSLLAFIPARVICCQRSPRRPSRCRSARELRR